MTSSSALKSLKITAFRGSSTTFTLPFEVGRKLTLVYGENGTGKSTLLHMLLRTSYPDSGHIHWFGKPYAGELPLELRQP